MKALVAISVSREWTETDFLMQFGSWYPAKNWQVRFGWFRQFTAQERHNVAMNEAKFDYDRVLFMDTDQYYPQDYIVRMLEHTEPVVTGINISRYNPYEPTVYKIEPEIEQYGVKVPKFTGIEPPAKKIFECDATGTGALMVDVSILDKLKHPYFKDVYEETGCVRLIPDDFYFSWQLHKAKIPITVDQSIVVRHSAKTEVSIYNCIDMRKAWAKVNSGHGYWKDGVK